MDFKKPNKKKLDEQDKIAEAFFRGVKIKKLA